MRQYFPSWTKKMVLLQEESQRHRFSTLQQCAHGPVPRAPRQRHAIGPDGSATGSPGLHGWKGLSDSHVNSSTIMAKTESRNVFDTLDPWKACGICLYPGVRREVP